MKGCGNMKRALSSFCICIILLFPTQASSAAAVDPGALSREIARAAYFVDLFEQEVANLRGSTSARYINKTEAANRVRTLHERHPDDPRVQELFARMREAMMKTQGDHVTITPEMLAYREQEKTLQAKLGALADQRWAELLAEAEVKAKEAVRIRKEEDERLRERVATLKEAGDKQPESREQGPSVSEQEVKKFFDELEEQHSREVARRRDGVAERLYDSVITNPFPIPDWSYVGLQELEGAFVVLQDVRFPENQFLGGAGEFIFVGKPSTGYWFVRIDGREWLGPWEAMKRCRREAVGALEDVKSWTVLGRITAILHEVPQAEEKKTMASQVGWEVTPVALHVPGLLTAWYDPNNEKNGLFAGENDLKSIRESTYSIKALPANATPLQVMETFVAAIKEKNRELYMACVNPELYKTNVGYDLVANYHWDLHQGRFRREYVAVTFGEPRFATAKGFDAGDKDMDYFLSDEQKNTARQIGGTQVEYAYIECKAWDENGRQYGSPKEYQLIRVGGGPWLVESYNIPF